MGKLGKITIFNGTTRENHHFQCENYGKSPLSMVKRWNYGRGWVMWKMGTWLMKHMDSITLFLMGKHTFFNGPFSSSLCHKLPEGISLRHWSMFSPKNLVKNQAIQDLTISENGLISFHQSVPCRAEVPMDILSLRTSDLRRLWNQASSRETELGRSRFRNGGWCQQA